ncbi:MAG: hypothetical protein LBE36_05975 [Flavobacteriaceae bacterium]|jgi:YD repeat-containing protein|nr:hypothetical protein [Flavobacteriaceae bacterium]
MKKILLLLPLFLFSALFSQQWTPIPGFENEGTENVVPPDHDGNDEPPTSGLVTEDSQYHDTKGQIDVSGSGELTYTLPIALPPGIKSVAPQINLVYGSNIFSGIAGIGWNIAGLSSISRVGRNIEEDGEVKGVQFNYTDLYQFNGQRLILLSGEYGKDGATYTTQQFSNLKIKSIGTGSIPNNTQGPQGFEVNFEDGSTATFGMAANSYNHHEYNITKWVDVHGNYITYNYVNENNTLRIDNIQWGGNQTIGSAHFNKIQFVYKTRNIKQFAYANGIKSIQDKILDYISVYANNALFRKYALTYYTFSETDKRAKHEILNTITESNAAGETARPITFTRQADEALITGKTSEYTPETLENEKAIKGDFDGDGKLDILNYVPDVLDGYWEYIDPYCDWDPCDKQFIVTGVLIPAHTELKLSGLETNYTALNVHSQDLTQRAFVANLLSKDGKTMQKQALINYKEEIDSLRIDTYFLENGKMQLEYTKKIPRNYYIDNMGPLFGFPVTEYHDYFSGVGEMDINSDGISELILGKYTTVLHHDVPYDCDGNDPNQPDAKEKCYHDVQGPNIYSTYVVNPNPYINPDPANTDSIYPMLYGMDRNIFANSSFTDFNGDGIQEATYLTDQGVGAYRTVYTYTPVKQPDGKYKLQGVGFASIEGDKAGIIYSDINGDGKTDIMIPQGSGWNFYFSNGRGFEPKYFTTQFGAYTPKTLDIGNTHRNEYEFYYAKDINRDGLADFIKVKSWIWDPGAGDDGDSSYGVEIYENRGLGSDGKISFVNTYYTWPQDNDNCGTCSTWTEPYLPLVGDFRIDNKENFLLLTHGPQLLKFTYYDASERARLTAIEQGRLTTDIEYKVLDDRVDSNFYKGSNTMLFPYTEVERLPQTKVVSQIKQGVAIQEFRYRGLIANAHGKGLIGFRKTARTNLYSPIPGLGASKIWTGIEMDPTLDGLPIKQWSTTQNSEIFPTNLSTSNTNLFSYKETAYLVENIGGRKIKLPNYVKEKDNLTGVLKETTVTYDTTYYLPQTTTVNYDNGYAATVSVLEYLHNPSGTGNNYYIGRPWKKQETVNAYQDTKTTKEEYHYSGVNMDYSLKYAFDLTKYIKESYTYDAWGNVLSKTVSSSENDFSPRTESSTYETLGRFVKTRTSVLGTVTEFQYTDFGMLKYEKDPFGNTVNYYYDAWGKLISETSSLSGIVNYTYFKYTDGSSAQKAAFHDGDEKWTYYDKFGRNTKLKVKAPQQGKYIVTDIVYDLTGRKTSESEPYFELESNSKVNTFSYDQYSRPIQQTMFNGKSATTVYDGKTVKVTDNTGRIKKKTVDALGNVISSEDPGGIVQFKYNAAGQQLTATYGNNIVKTEYDEWGRRSSFHDPNNGKYYYTYYSDGSLKKETSPKGYKEYFYTATGLLDHVNEKSNDNTSTNKNYSFIYNAYGQVTKKTGMANGKTFLVTYEYQANGRQGNTLDAVEDKTFQNRDIVYDAYGNVKSYKKYATSGSTTSIVSIQNIYSPWDGSLYQVKDYNTGKILWELQSTNAAGQVLQAKLGAAQVTNTYDYYGFLTNAKHVSAGGTLVNTDYSFNAAKNELNSRHDYVLGINEQFYYDEDGLHLNRLTSWTDPLTGNLHKNSYDATGRITTNHQVGTMAYAQTGAVYRPTGMGLNAAGMQNYDYTGNSKLLQSISYNENNDPIKIDGTQADYAFEYGFGETRRVMYFGNNFTTNSAAAKVKYYSEDTTMEVVIDKATGQQKHLIYIGGSPYEANIVYLKDFTQSSGSYQFLHKDYLGSILAVSDEYGGIQEIRHFDAWGNMTHLKSGNLAVTTDPNVIANRILLIDRGYTGHEHLLKVGLIHMNGRLYDPLLRRFTRQMEKRIKKEHKPLLNEMPLRFRK